MTERQVQNKIATTLRKSGAMVIKMTAVSIGGFPDLLVLAPNTLAYFIECKAPGKKPTRRQEIIHKKIRKLGFDVIIVDK